MRTAPSRTNSASSGRTAKIDDRPSECDTGSRTCLYMCLPPLGAGLPRPEKSANGIDRSADRGRDLGMDLRPAVEAYLHMVAAAGEDLVGAVTGEDQGDLFELRDPRYIAQTLPALRLMSKGYFRADVTGLEN